MRNAGSSSEWYQDLDVLEQTVRSSFGSRHAVPKIDGYVDLKELSRGGQGIVYLATQQSTKRTVAIKVLIDGVYASASRRIRFEREIGLAANLRHPNIVRVYDSGVTDDDRLFLVMEYIDGIPLDVFVGASTRNRADSADPTLIPGDDSMSTTRASLHDPSTIAHLLDIKTAIKLFAKICDAVSHAHQHGVIHRDLKPSNIHVDQNAEPHVLDFGLAKTAPGSPFDPTDTPLVSITGNFMGSAPWASPEQASGDTGETDTRTDVYALGVILYQMITGRFPYTVTGNLREVLDHICTTEPTRPSAIRKHIDDELETIVLKCLAKEPQRRYQTASELAGDIHRYLAGEPIEAKRASAWYAVRRTMRRYQLAAGFLAVILLISIAFAVTALVLYNKADQAKVAEREARLAAQQQATTATRVREFLETMLTSIRPENAKGRDVTLLAEVLEEAATRIEEELGDQPEIAMSLHTTIGQTYKNLSQYAQADHHLSRAYQIGLREFGAENTETITVQNDIGVLRADQGRLDEAEQVLRDALEKSKKVRGLDHFQTLEIVSNLAVILRRQNKNDEAETLCRQAVQAQKKSGSTSDHRYLMLLNNLGSILQQKGNPEEAEQYYRESLDGYVKLYGEKHPATLVSEANLAHLLSESNRIEEAEALLRHNLQLSREVLGDAHASTLTAMNNLGPLLQRKGEYPEAESILREALAGRIKTLGKEHEHTLLTMSNLSVCLQSQEKFEEAEQLQRESVEILRKKHGDQHLSAMIGMNNLASFLHAQGKYDEAQALLEVTCKNAQQSLGDDHWITAVFRANYGNTLVSLERYEEAESLLLNSLDVVTTVLGADHAHVASIREKIVRLYEKWEKPERADSYRDPNPDPNSKS